MLDRINALSTPYHVIDMDKLKNNIDILKRIGQESDCKILYALKCFPNDVLSPYVRENLDGVCASGLFEARLGKSEFKKEVHTFSTAYSDYSIDKISEYSDFVTFNSTQQWERYQEIPKGLNRKIGLRINPEYSEINNFNIDPCHEHSRFGVTSDELYKINLNNLNFLLVHNMCGQFHDTLFRSLDVVEQKFGGYLKAIEHLNLGGGQLFTHSNYDISKVVSLLNSFGKKHGISLYLEPGEALIYNASHLVTSVVDIIYNGIATAVLDASAICHMPDVVFSGYACDVKDSVTLAIAEESFRYRLAGPTCYAGDIFGDFNFAKPLKIGDQIVIADSLNYTSVKSNMFNGIPLPSLVSFSKAEGYKLIKNYDFSTYFSII